MKKEKDLSVAVLIDGDNASFDEDGRCDAVRIPLWYAVVETYIW